MQIILAHTIYVLELLILRGTLQFVLIHFGAGWLLHVVGQN